MFSDCGDLPTEDREEEDVFSPPVISEFQSEVEKINTVYSVHV